MGVLMTIVVVIAALLVVPLAVLLQAALFRMVADGIADARVGWVMALVTVVVSGLVQSCAMGTFFGADGGLLGTLFGWAVWSGMVSVLNQIDFGKALLVGLVMAVVQWLLVAGLVVLGAVLGIGALVGAAAVL